MGEIETSRRKLARSFKSYEGVYPDDRHIRLTENMMKADACRSLSGNAFKLYSYMKQWARGRDEFEFSTTLAAKIGLSAKSFYRARDELIEKGFIVFENQTGAKYKHETCHFSFSDRWQIWEDSS